MASMHIVWRRPDGFHGAAPEDFVVLEIGDSARLWLHKADKDWFPFRISGDWQEDQATKRLNNLVNLINKPISEWVQLLTKEFHNSKFDDASVFYEDLMNWLASLSGKLKGDRWEMEIMEHVLSETKKQLSEAKASLVG